MIKDLSLNNSKQGNLLQYQKLTIVATIIIVGFTISVFYHYLMGTFMGHGFPFNTFLFAPGDQFNDFFNNFNQITLTGKGVFPPEHNFTNYLFYLPSLFSFNSRGLTYMFYAGVFVVYLFMYNYSHIKKLRHFGDWDWSLLMNSFVFTFMSYPVLFAIDRGNQEMYIFILLSLSIFSYYKNKYFISAVLLGFAIHLKIYFAVFLIIYISDKKYKEIGFVIFLFFILPILAFIIDKWLFPTIQFSGSIFIFLKSASSTENWYNSLYVLGDCGAAYCSSLYGGLKAIIYFIHPDILAGSPPIHFLFSLYFRVSVICSGIIALYVMFFEKEAWKKVTLVALILILFPFVTADYRLILLFIPLWLFISSKEPSKYNILYGIIFGLLLIPKDYYFIRDMISISVIINPLLIIIFMIVLVHEGFYTKFEKLREINKYMRRRLTK